MELFDFFLSVGPACRPARHIQYNNLRTLASPLDWQYGYSLNTVIDLFNTSFNSFFTSINENEKKEGADGCRRVVDTTNKIISIHHFPKDISLEEGHKKFRDSMMHRYILLDEKLKQCKRIAIVCNRYTGIKQLGKFLFKFSEIYPHLDITLIHVYSRPYMNKTGFKKKTFILSPNLSIVQYRFNDIFNFDTKKPFDWIGNETHWNRVFQEYDLKSRVCEFGQIKDKPIVIYGTTDMTSKLVEVLKKYEITATSIITDTHAESSASSDEMPVNQLSEYSKDSLILLAYKEASQTKHVKEILKKKGYNNTLRVDFEHGVYLNIEDLHQL